MFIIIEHHHYVLHLVIGILFVGQLYNSVPMLQFIAPYVCWVYSEQYTTIEYFKDQAQSIT